jgi:ribonuclease P protein component
MAGQTKTATNTHLAGSSPYRFRKANRLLNAAAYSRVFKKATRSRDKWFTVLCRENNVGPARLGLAISKKNCRLATERNRIKRIVRESFRQHQSLLVGVDVVVMNSPAAKSATNRQLIDSLGVHWGRCGKTTEISGQGNLENG